MRARSTGWIALGLVAGLAAGLATGVAGCGGSGTTPAPGDAADVAPDVPDRAEAVVFDLPSDPGRDAVAEAGPDVARDGWTDGLDQAAPDATPADGTDPGVVDGGLPDAADDGTAACAGGSGCPCGRDTDCYSGLCLLTTTGRECAGPCTGGCRKGWECRTAGAPDPASYCFPLQPTLCKPCRLDSDCAVLGLPDASLQCVSYGDDRGGFCGGECASDDDCPDGFSCVQMRGSMQCVADDLACTCPPWAAGMGASTDCARTNAAGTCRGTRSCGAGGLTECSAKEPAPETCNGLDDDCDGLTDEDLGTTPCGTGLCRHLVPACVGGQPGACDPLEGQGVESCNNQDDDCDGVTDEDLGETTCGKGACAHTVPNCRDGAPQACDAYAGQSPETCNGIDDDCDGLTDEELGSTTCGKGACAHTVANCAGGVAQACDPLQGASPEACDGIDDDCDGLTDEDLGSTTCGQGVCEHTVANCVGGAPQTCDPFAGKGVETCNGKDDDCDGSTDEDLGSTTCGTGACRHDQANCVDGSSRTCDPYLGLAVETCNGIDDDCDGQTDEDLGSTTCGKGACAHTVANCAGGVAQACDPLQGASPEVCDGIDDDCDGLTDEDLGSTTCGQGVCEHTVANCVGGVPQACDPFAGKGVETCNGKDDDCDGLTDEDLGSTTCGVGQCVHTVPNCAGGVGQACDPKQGASPEVCDGVDNDCNGKTDAEDLAAQDANGYFLADHPACDNVKGVCRGARFLAASCTGGAWPAACGTADYLQNSGSYQPGVETLCDGYDNDCDGTADEDFQATLLDGRTVSGVGQACGAGICAGGVTACTTDLKGITCPKEVLSQAETCNGLDDDCNGLTDDGSAKCPVTVTFNVDMSCTANVAVPQFAGGTLFGVPGDHPMADPDGDMIWTTTYPVAQDLTTKYIFTNGICLDWTCKEQLQGLPCAVAPYNDRGLTTGSADMAVTECFGRCLDAPCGQCPSNAPAPAADPTCDANSVKVTFQVDLGRTWGTARDNTIVVNGDFNAWTPGIVLHRRTDRRTVYAGNVCVAKDSTLYYKFTGYGYINDLNEFPNNAYDPAHNPCPGQTRTQACAYGNCTDRILVTGATDQVLDVTYWASCDSYPLP